jgi:hypothetical protein
MSIFNKIFDFDFFGKKAKEKLKEVQNINDFLLQREREEAVLINPLKKPYKNIIYSNGIITVIFKDGNVISAAKPLEIVEIVKNATDESQVITLLKTEKVKPQLDKNKEEAENIQKFAKYKEEVLELLGEDFNCKNEQFFYKNISLPINSLILNSLIEHKKNNAQEEYNALIHFFLWSAANPIEESRNDLYKAVKQYDVKLTNNGQLVTFRSVWKVAKDTALLEYVSEQYFKKKRHKKSPSNYSIYSSDDFEGLKTVKNHKITEYDFQSRNHIIVGNLNELYNFLQKADDNRYTDDYTRKQDIRIGSIYKLPEEFELGKRGSCGGALHTSLSKDAYNYNGYGDTQVVAIVNPMYVYRMDTGSGGKIGVKEMFIAAKEDEKNIKENLVNFDDVYSTMSILELENSLQNKSFETISVQEEVPVINLTDLKQITQSLKSKIVNF